MRVAVIIPSRGDRPEFLNNCLRMMFFQTRPPDTIKVVNYTPKSDDYDITERYRKGYEELAGYDLIAFIEEDDWYSPIYLETMINQFEAHGSQVIGIKYTIYYHLKLGRYFTMHHERRASTMSTVVMGGLNIDWPLDRDPFPDVHLWLNNKHLNKKELFSPKEIIAVGIKHGTGKCVRNSHHANRLHKFVNEDNGFLKSTVDKMSFEFYQNLTESLNDS